MAQAPGTTAIIHMMDEADVQRVLRAGAYADLVLFNPVTVIDRGTFESPKRHPAGIVDVFVNGTAVIRDARSTAARPGRVLRRRA